MSKLKTVLLLLASIYVVHSSYADEIDDLKNCTWLSSLGVQLTSKDVSSDNSINE